MDPIDAWDQYSKAMDERDDFLYTEWRDGVHVEGDRYLEAIRGAREMREWSARGSVAEGAWRNIHVTRYESVENIDNPRATSKEITNGIPAEPWTREPWDYDKHRQITGEFVEQLRNMGASEDLVDFAEKHRTDKPRLSVIESASRRQKILSRIRRSVART